MELLVVLVVLGIMSGILFSVIKINFFLGKSRDAKRDIEVSTIATAVYQYTLDKGGFPAGMTTTPTEICNQNAAGCTGYVDLSPLLSGEQYLLKIPEDPLNDNPNGTGYYIWINAADRIMVSATFAEGTTTINATR